MTFCFEDSIDRVTKVIEAAGGKVISRSIAPGMSDLEIGIFEGQIGFRLDEGSRTLYRDCGEAWFRWELGKRLGGFEWPGFAEVKRRIENWNPYAEDMAEFALKEVSLEFASQLGRELVGKAYLVIDGGNGIDLMAHRDDGRVCLHDGSELFNPEIPNLQFVAPSWSEFMAEWSTWCFQEPEGDWPQAVDPGGSGVRWGEPCFDPALRMEA